MWGLSSYQILLLFLYLDVTQQSLIIQNDGWVSSQCVCVCVFPHFHSPQTRCLHDNMAYLSVTFPFDSMPLVNFASHVTSTTYKQAKEESSEDPLAGGQGKVRDIFQAALDEADEKGLQSLESKGELLQSSL